MRFLVGLYHISKCGKRLSTSVNYICIIRSTKLFVIIHNVRTTDSYYGICTFLIICTVRFEKHTGALF